MDNEMTFRVPDHVADTIEEIAETVGSDEGDVARRLLNLGLRDVDDVGTKVLFGSDASAEEVQ